MDLSIKIIYEDKDLLVIEKPAGIVVNKAESVKDLTIQEWAERKLNLGQPDLTKSDFYNRAGIVHRLDKETSGLLIIAKNEKTFILLQAQFKERIIKKQYLALVHGFMMPKEGKIDVPIERNPFNREKFGVFLGGRPSVTEYQVFNYYQSNNNQKDNYSLVKAFPKTGRTHQIRVHFKYLGYPIVSDETYSGRKTSRDDRQFCPRLFLHAYKLTFKQPTTSEEISLTNDLPKDLQDVLDKLTLLK